MNSSLQWENCSKIGNPWGHKVIRLLTWAAVEFLPMLPDGEIISDEILSPTDRSILQWFMSPNTEKEVLKEILQ